MTNNLSTYESKKVVGHYENYHGLQKPEQTIFDQLSNLENLRVLDIGVGGGRTTEYLAPRVKEYVGIDYAQGMVNACKKKFKDLTNARFVCMDARNLDRLGTETFDLVLFSFNGMDYVSHEDRLAVLKEVARVLRKGGSFIFSSHNLFAFIDLKAFEFRLNLWAAVKRVLQVKKIKSLNRPQLATASKAGYVIINDGAHDFGLDTYYVRPSFQAAQLKQGGFDHVKIYKLTDGKRLEPGEESNSAKEKWLYYLCTKD